MVWFQFCSVAKCSCYPSYSTPRIPGSFIFSGELFESFPLLMLIPSFIDHKIMNVLPCSMSTPKAKFRKLPDLLMSRSRGLSSHFSTIFIQNCLNFFTSGHIYLFNSALLFLTLFFCSPVVLHYVVMILCWKSFSSIFNERTWPVCITWISIFHHKIGIFLINLSTKMYIEYWLYV